MSEPSVVIIRDVNTGSDHAFIYATWRNALWFAEKRDDKDGAQFYNDASKMIAALLKQSAISVRVACLSDDLDMLLGWAVLAGQNLEFVYVKWDYRRKGIGKLLTKGFKTFSEPKTKIGKSLASKLGISSVVEQPAVNR